VARGVGHRRLKEVVGDGGELVVNPVAGCGNPHSHKQFTRTQAGPLRTGVRGRIFPVMDRLYEIENLRRSLAMLPPGTKALDREDAMKLLGELHEVETRLRNLRKRPSHRPRLGGLALVHSPGRAPIGPGESARAEVLKTFPTSDDA